MPISVSTDQIHPAERQAFWTESICRSFAHIETRPIGPTRVSGHFEFVELGSFPDGESQAWLYRLR